MLLSGKRLDGAQSQQFREALKGAFDTSTFPRMLWTRLNIHLEKDIIVVKDNSLEDIIDKVIAYVEQESKTTQLLQAARKERPDDAALFAFAQLFGLSFPEISLHALESTIKPQNKYHDLAPLIKRITELESQVCMIEDDRGAHLGTGFLVGPGIVITCHHVVEEQLSASPGRLRCHFDYKIMSDGTTLNEGVRYRMLQCLTYSERSPFDDQGPGNGLPAVDQLDYALFSVAHSPDDDKADGTHDIRQRGWIAPLMQKYNFQPKSSIFIIHHPTPPRDVPPPQHPVMKYSQDTDAIISINQNGTRVLYTTNTEHGSSGAPCFNDNWDIVALHQSGDPLTKKFHAAQYNQGIPFFAILTLLELRGMRKCLDTPSLERVEQVKDTCSDAAPPTHEQNAVNRTQNTTYPELGNSSQPFPPSKQAERKGMGEQIDRNDLLDRLHNSTPGNLNKTISYFPDVPEDIREESLKSKKIDSLVRWAEGPDGPGLKALNDTYERVIGKKNRRG